MITDFKNITELLIREGFHELTDKKESEGKPLDFNITPYSLNTKLSFKFDNLPHFVEFLRLHDVAWIEEKNAAVLSTLNELGLDPNEFFYVNFFEKNKEAQM